MSLVNRLLGRSGSGPPELNLAEVQARLTQAVPRRAGQPTDPDLVRARLADGCRDAGVEPLLPEGFEKLAAGLDDEAWRRLAVLVDLLDLELGGAVRGILPRLVAGRALAEVVSAAFTGLARETPLLTLELLRQSPLRMEELARRFIAGLGASIRGESAAVSRQRLERLDYARLLTEAEQAREAAAERMEQLRQLQDEQEQRRPRRGKW